MPGLEEKDIEVLLIDGVLTLKGEKRSETERQGTASSPSGIAAASSAASRSASKVSEDQVDARFQERSADRYPARRRRRRSRRSNVSLSNIKKKPEDILRLFLRQHVRERRTGNL